MILLASIIHSHNINILSYADDTQLILSLTDKTPSTQIKFMACMTESAHWLKTNCLKLNTDKTEIVIFGKKHITVALHLVANRARTDNHPYHEPRDYHQQQIQHGRPSLCRHRHMLPYPEDAAEDF